MLSFPCPWNSLKGRIQNKSLNVDHEPLQEVGVWGYVRETSFNHFWLLSAVLLYIYLRYFPANSSFFWPSSSNPYHQYAPRHYQELCHMWFEMVVNLWNLFDISYHGPCNFRLECKMEILHMRVQRLQLDPQSQH